MNLKWSDLGEIYFPVIGAGMGKHCDLAHIIDPAQRAGRSQAEFRGENNPQLNLTAQQCAFSFDLMVAPNHRGHIVGPGRYRIEVVVAAQNARPEPHTFEINLSGPWYPNEADMLRDGVGVQVIN